MASISAKVDYVKAQRQTRNHHCHWTGCDKQVPSAMWGCKKHWYMLPIALRNKIWAAYQPGQEVSGTPSNRYLEVAHEALAWIREYQKGQLAYEVAKRDMRGDR